MIYLVGQSCMEFQSSTVQDCLNYFKDKKYVQVDTETESNRRNPDHLPNPYENKVLCIQIGDYENQWVIDLNVDISPLKVLMEDPAKVKLFTNAFFDLRFFHHWGWNIVNVYDCFLAEKIITCGKKFPKGYLGLGGMAERYCGVQLKKEVRGQIHWRGLDTAVITYAAEDVKYMELIMHEQSKKIAEYKLEKCVRLENKHIISLSRISYKGFKMDVERWKKYAEFNELRLIEQEKLVNEYVVSLGWNEFVERQLDLFNPEIKSNINWNSSKQVLKLFEKLGIDCLVRDPVTGLMKESVDGKHLQRQVKKFPILPIYLKYKEIGKELSTYGEDFLKQNLNPVSGRVHSEFFPIVDTGRISSSRPNLQNIPALAEDGTPNPLRKCFIAGEGRRIVIADYSGQEDRILADRCQDPLLTETFLKGSGDTHSLTATAISPFFFGKEVEVTKKNNPMVEYKGQRIRDIAKILNFKMAYGGTAFTLKDDLECTQEEAQSLIDLIVNKFKGKQDYFKKCHQEIHKNGYIIIDPITNRRSYFSGYDEFLKLKAIPWEQRTKQENSQYAKLKGSMERMSQNYKIQGSAGSMTKLAVVLFDEEVRNQGLDAFIVNAVHDELVVEASEEDAEKAAALLQECMEKSGKIFCKTIPIIAEPSIGTDWGAK